MVAFTTLEIETHFVKHFLNGDLNFRSSFATVIAGACYDLHFLQRIFPGGLQELFRFFLRVRDLWLQGSQSSSVAARVCTMLGAELSRSHAPEGRADRSTCHRGFDLNA